MSDENFYSQADHNAQDSRVHREDYRVRSAPMSKSLGSWEELIEWVRLTLGDVQDLADGQLLRFVSDGEGIGMYRYTSLTSTQWVSLGVKLGRDTDVPAVTALHASFDMPLGGLGIADNYLFLVQKLPIPLLTDALVDETLRGLVQQGRAIRSAIERKSDVGDVYGHFAE